MSIVIVPGDKILSEADVHVLLAASLDFGPYYGKNLDALWDRLTTDVERPVRIIWASASKSRERLGDDLFFRIVGVLRRVEEQDIELGYSDRLTIELEE